MKLRIGSRESRLAVIQAELLMGSIRAWDPAAELELVTMKTTGDIILNRTLDQIGGKGLFVKELDAALLDGRVDVTVHSCKDLPMAENPALPLAGFSRREDPRDVLVLPQGAVTLDSTKPVGCSSKRRAMQLQGLLPGIRVESIRGNVQTRLKKLDSGEYSALVLAAAGLKRLGLEGRISRYFSVEEILPAAGQGILAAQTRAGMDLRFLECFLDRDSGDCARAERAFVRALDGGCSSPVAAYATVDADTMTLRGMDALGRKYEITGPRDRGEALADILARQTKEGEP
ncbi:MAG: hydroxymethylbilane synthase [Eubacteriales bacterium]|nr:hydroxymethylbilane synthase [Eubacteriales bacterium]